ncbi:MAG: hypothetical protein ACI9QC_000619 [Oceanicoccus sp.]|jgi:hypothetical protein
MALGLFYGLEFVVAQHNLGGYSPLEKILPPSKAKEKPRRAGLLKDKI